MPPLICGHSRNRRVLLWWLVGERPPYLGGQWNNALYIVVHDHLRKRSITLVVGRMTSLVVSGIVHLIFGGRGNRIKLRFTKAALNSKQNWFEISFLPYSI